MLKRIQKTLITALLLAFIVQKTNAQKLDWYNYKQTVVYKLDYRQIDLLYQLWNANKINFPYNHYLDSTVFYTNEVARQRTDTQKINVNKFGAGGYLWVRFDNLQNPLVQFVQNTSYQVQLVVLNGKNILYIKDSASRNISYAKVKIDSFELKYNSSLGGYEYVKTIKKHVEKLIYLNVNGFSSIFQYYLYVPYTNPKKDYTVKNKKYNYSNLYNAGYFVSSQPVYRIGDTVKYKAFLVNRKGKPIKRKVDFSVFQNSYSYRTNGTAYQIVPHRSKKKPDYPGAFSGTFVVPDTWKIDQYYMLSLWNKRSKNSKSVTIKIEDYELDLTDQSVKAIKNSISPGEKALFLAEHKDKNGLPIMDGRIKMVIRLNNITQFDSLWKEIPYAHYRTYKTIEKAMDPSGNTEFSIPFDSFHNAEGSYYANFYFIGADNSMDSSLNHQIYTNLIAEKWDYKFNEDSLKVQYLIKNKNQIRDIELRYMTTSNRIAARIKTQTGKKIATPLQAHYCQIYYHDTFVATQYVYAVEGTSIEGKRTGDSILISLKGKRGVTFNYRIFKMAKLIDSGQVNKLEFKAKDETDASYHIYFTHNFYGAIETNWRVASFHVKEANLNVRFIHPENIYPGEKVGAEILVTDVHNKPVKGVNLAAYGINTQLPGIQEPEISYMGKTKPDEYLNITNYNMNPFAINTYARINNKLVSRFKLLNYNYGKMVFAPKGKTIVSDSSHHSKPQVQFYAFSGAEFHEKIYYILDNEKLIYCEHFLPKQIQSFLIEEGKHKFKVRLRNRLVEFDLDSAKSRKVYYVGLNTDSLKKYNIGDTANVLVYSKAEREMLRKHTLYMALYPGISYAVNLRLNNFPYSPVVKPFSNHDSRQYGRYDKLDFYHAIGPVDSGIQRIQIRGYDIPLNFIPDKKYVFLNNEIVQAEWKEKNEIMYLGSAGYIEIPAFWNLHVDIVDPVISTPPPKYVAPPPAATVYRRGSIAGGYFPNYLLKDSCNGTIQIYNRPNGNFDAWLFNERDSQFSILGQNQTSFDLFRKDNYSLVFITDTGNFIMPIKFFGDEIKYCLNLKYATWRKNNTESLFPYINKALEIVGNDFYSFNDTPSIYKPLINSYKIKSDLSEVRGIVLNQENNEPAEGVRVLLEKDGVFISGSTTNYYGKFSMPKIPAGKYQIKFSHPQYKYRVYYSLEVGQSQLIKLGMAMKPFFYQDRSKRNYSWDFGDGESVGSVSPSYSNDAMAAPESRITYNASTMKLNSVEIAGRSSSFKRKAMQSLKKPGVASRDDMERKDEVDSDGDGMPETRDIDGVADMYDKSQLKDSKKQRYDWLSPNESIYEKVEALNKNTDINKKPTKSLRTNFKESAFWIPNLYTDQKGKVHFTANYPDNITSWQLYAPAINGKRQSGLGSMVVKSYLPVSANLIMPNFMVEGDKFLIRSRMVNYSGNELDAEVKFNFNGTVQNRNIKLDKTFMDSFWSIAPKAGDSANYISTLKLKNGYEDGEKRFLITKPNAVIETKGLYYDLPKDTMITITIPQDVDLARLIINKSAFEHILELLDELESYPYGCIEQTATKLKGLLVKQSILAKIGGTFTKESEARIMLANLKKWQNKDGSWGWWPNSGSNAWMTAYVSDVLFYAQQAGYNNRAYIDAEKYLSDKFSTFDNATKPFVLHQLKKQNANVNFSELEKYVNQIDMSTTEKLEWMRYKQLSGKATSALEVKSLLVRDGNGGLFIPGNKYSFYSDEARNTFLGYLILKDQDPSAVELNYMAKYFMSGLRVPAHTVARIEGVEVALDHAIFSKGNSNVIPNLWVNGIKIDNDKLPYKQKFKAGETVKIENKGAESFFYISTDKLVKNKPENVTNLLRISTEIDKKTDTLVKCKVSTVSMLTATVTAVESMEYTMVEIPIPAGCSYAKKWNGTLPGETYREYKYDRVIVYFEKLPQGKYTIQIPLQNRFEGEFNVPPSRAAMMYYTEAAGYERAKKVVLGN